MSKSTKPAKRSKSTKLAEKPEKPYEGFPLFAHATGRWAKKIRGRLHYFGYWRDDPKGAAALEKLNAEWPYLREGCTPPPVDSGDGLTVAGLADTFLNAKRGKMEAGELSERSWIDYHRTCALLVDRLGTDRRVDDLRPDDFAKLRAKMAKRWSPATLGNEINRIRTIFRFAYRRKLIAEEIDYGGEFDKPSQRVLRRDRNTGGAKLFTADELRLILDALDGKLVQSRNGGTVKRKRDPQLRAMVLLAINCSFGNGDVADLEQKAVDLDGGWIDYPRPKTGINRRVPLWPETVDALREAIAQRPEPKDKADAGLCFVTREGRRFVRIVPKRDDESGRYIKRDTITNRFGSLLKRLGINDRRRLGFYSCRHTFRTVADGCRDQPAIDSIMGHADKSMAGNYRHGISDDRLRAVTDTVHRWLFSE